MVPCLQPRLLSVNHATLHRDVSGQRAETTPLPNVARRVEAAQPGISATPSLGQSPQTPTPAPQLLRARRLPHPSPTACPPWPGCSADFSALVSPSRLLTWVSRSRRHGPDGTDAAPPSVGGAAATELREGREEPLHRSDTLPPPPLPRNPRWRMPTPPIQREKTRPETRPTRWARPGGD